MVKQHYQQYRMPVTHSGGNWTFFCFFFRPENRALSVTTELNRSQTILQKGMGKFDTIQEGKAGRYSCN